MPHITEQEISHLCKIIQNDEKRLTEVMILIINTSYINNRNHNYINIHYSTVYLNPVITNFPAATEREDKTDAIRVRERLLGCNIKVSDLKW